MKTSDDFETIVGRTKILKQLGFSNDLKSCAIKAVEIELGNSGISKLATEFGITKDDLAKQVANYIEFNGQIPGQQSLF